LLTTNYHYRDDAETKLWLKIFAALIPRAQSVHRSGSSVLDLAYVACGRYDAAWEFGLQDSNLAAGALLIREAGGFVSDLSGDANIFKSGNVVAGAPKVYEKLRHILDNIK